MGDCTALDTTATPNDLERKKEPDERKMDRMAQVYDFLEMCQGSQNLHAAQKECRAQNKQMTTIECISDMEEIVEVSWSVSKHDGAAAFQLSERSPLPPAMSANDLPGGRTQVSIVCRIRWIDHRRAKSNVDSAPESISDTKDWLTRNGHSDDPNCSEDIWEADNISSIELDKGIKALDGPEDQIVSATLSVPGMIRPTWSSMQQAQKGLLTAKKK